MNSRPKLSRRGLVIASTLMAVAESLFWFVGFAQFDSLAFALFTGGATGAIVFLLMYGLGHVVFDITSSPPHR